MTCSDTPKLWRDMTPEEKGALLLADHEGRQIDMWFARRGAWVDSISFSAYDDIAYRVHPEPEPEPTPMVVPWEALADWVQWVARDDDDPICGYEKKPDECDLHWVPTTEKYCRLDGVKIDPGTCDWRDSLQKRPEGV